MNTKQHPHGFALECRIAALEKDLERKAEGYNLALAALCKDIARLLDTVELLRGALKSAQPVYETSKNSSAVRSGHQMSGSITHYTIQPHVLHEALNESLDY